MNAAFLLVTSACLTGQPVEAKPGPVPPPAAAGAPIVAPHGTVPYGTAPYGTACCDPCGCDNYGYRLRDRLRGLFNRDCHQDTCCGSAGHGHGHAHGGWRSNQCCDDGWRGRFFNRGHGHDGCCQTNNNCCDDGGWFGRLRGWFRRGDRGCCGYNNYAGGCYGNNCVGGACGPTGIVPGGPIAPPQKIDVPPKKMPEPAKTPPAGKTEVNQSNTVPPIANAPPVAIPNTPAAPSVEITPAPAAPRVEGDRRDPF